MKRIADSDHSSSNNDRRRKSDNENTKNNDQQNIRSRHTNDTTNSNRSPCSHNESDGTKGSRRCCSNNAEVDSQNEDDQESGCGNVGLGEEEEEEEDDDDEQDDNDDFEKPETNVSARGDDKIPNKKDAPVVATRRSARACRKPMKRGFSSNTSVDSENINKSLKQKASNSTKEKRRRSNEDDKAKSNKKKKGNKGNKSVEDNNDEEDEDGGGGDSDHENESGMEQKKIVAAARNNRKKSEVKKNKKSMDDIGNDDDSSSDSDEDGKTRAKCTKADHVGSISKKNNRSDDEEDGDEDSDDNLNEMEHEGNAADEADSTSHDRNKGRELGHLKKKQSGGKENAETSITYDDDDEDDDKPILATIKRKQSQPHLQQEDCITKNEIRQLKAENERLKGMNERLKGMTESLKGMTESLEERLKAEKSRNERLVRLNQNRSFESLLSVEEDQFKLEMDSNKSSAIYCDHAEATAEVENGFELKEFSSKENEAISQIIASSTLLIAFAEEENDDTNNILKFKTKHVGSEMDVHFIVQLAVQDAVVLLAKVRFLEISFLRGLTYWSLYTRILLYSRSKLRNRFQKTN
jgi:hypothetical protein